MDMQVGLEVGPLGNVESVKWDNGWWSADKLPIGWGANEGDWNEIRDPYYLALIQSYGCSTLKEFAALCKERGLNFTTYVLLHDALNTNPEALTSLGENGHPEWFSNRTNSAGGIADLGNQECVDWLKTKLLSFFKGNGVPTWRTDFEPIAFSSDKQNRHFANGNDVQYWCATGFYEIIDYLYDNYADFRYENCSSGGSLKDFATMTRAVIINNDDSADFNSLRTSFYDSSYCLPPAQLQAPTNPDKFMKQSAYYTNSGDADFGFRSIILGTFSTGSWSGAVAGNLQFGLAEYYQKYYTMYQEKNSPLGARR